MRRFAALLDRLAFTPARTDKLRLITAYLAEAPDPDRGWALAALTGELSLGRVTPARLREMVGARVDPVLFALSYDFVGDLAETIALIWPGPDAAVDDGGDLALGAVIARLEGLTRAEVPGAMAGLLDSLPPAARYALLKLATGGLRVGVSAGLAKAALAQFSGRPVEEIVELWHGLSPPYAALFDWFRGGEKPVNALAAPFRPVMLSTPIDAEGLAPLPPGDYIAEWKWDGIRVQAVAEGTVRRLWSRTGEDISGAFPDLVAAMGFDGALDGELLVRRDGAVGSFADLQQRLNRKTVSRALMTRLPAMLRAYDLLSEGETDLRPLSQEARRARLERFLAPLNPARFDLSAEVPFASWEELAAARAAPPEALVEGVMIKRRDTPYRAGRPRGPWFKWKRDPFLVDAILLYAQRGHGKRSGYYSDYTFGVWRGAEIVPVGKAYFGFTDAELRRIDRFVREATVDRFGPVRAVRPELVLEIAFEGLNRSSRHKSGIAMRFPRVNRIRWDKPAAQADTLETLEALL
ncbi:cisplatin damage response ATP-dependent DNA ligase (plasmid) [Paroceanicella profunda]|uniref:DNA ligase (ATP) n=1 Tax=Paroceanicella profunda TaxID=2579971 RepID=A0A5B8FIQ9_9RHOB|nr:cisplatin damage response ATP-dependent DNA ligase [Paroceanicella profunda]QDL94081.1 cisplatin damage response ATP-dependent DNA ligase [Paroceanicella profunda]